jgi:hypothetical protein
MIKKNYEIPEKVVEFIKESTARKGIGAQRIVATGAWILCSMNAEDRERALESYADWLEDKAIFTVDQASDVGDSIQGGRDQSKRKRKSAGKTG